MTTTPHLTVSHRPVDETGQLVHEGDLVAQLALAVTNLEAALAGRRLGWTDVTDLRISTTDPDGLTPVLDTVAERFPDAGRVPTVSVGVVPALSLPGMAVELTATASPTTTGADRPACRQESRT